MIWNKPRGATVYGIDLGKNIFHVVGADPAGNIIQRVKFRRDTLLAFFERAEPALVGMEACPGSQWLARKLQAMGHSVRIIPAQFVKPYAKSNKNDIIDAAAIAEAVVRPTMRFVQIKRPDQVDLQALHRIRDQLVSSRTRLICQMRAFCLEYGVAIRQGAGVFKIDLPRVIADELNDLTPTMRRLLAELFEDLGRLEKRIAEVTREIEGLAARNEAARRLMMVPGIGPLAVHSAACSRRLPEEQLMPLSRLNDGFEIQLKGIAFGIVDRQGYRWRCLIIERVLRDAIGGAPRQKIKPRGFALTALLSNVSPPTNSIWAHLKRMGSSALPIGGAAVSTRSRR